MSGTIGDHGVAILSQRELLTLGSDVRYDTAALHGLVATMLDAVPRLRVRRDPTRGGLAMVLNEMAAQSRVGMQLDETAIPVRRQVEAARASSSAWTHCTSPTRASASQSCRLSRRSGCSTRCARTHWAATRH